ncbi:MAG: hypothetical protein JXR60_09150 [Bacteroidales bacterium]|nr:hypothetical protein [Bacteroidales bacterium]
MDLNFKEELKFEKAFTFDLNGTQDKEKTYGQLANIVQEQLKQFRD